MEIEDITLDFNKICRLCLTEETVMMSLHNEGDADLDAASLPLRIMSCVSIDISQNDGLPSQICASCLCQVDGWYKFRDLCENADSILKKCIKNEPVQVETITQVKTLAQEVKKYFSSELKGETNDLSNQNKNMSPKKKMESSITRAGEPVMKCPPLLGRNIIGSNCLMAYSDIDQNATPAYLSIVEALQNSSGEILTSVGRNPHPPGIIQCTEKAIPTDVLGRVSSYNEIVVNSAIDNPIIKSQVEREQLVANFGPLQVYQINPSQSVFRSPLPPPPRENKNQGAFQEKSIKPKQCKWTDTSLDGPYISLSRSGNDPETKSEPKPESGEFENDDLSHNFPRTEFKKSNINECAENIEESKNKRKYKEATKSSATLKRFKKEDFGIGEDLQEYRVEKSVFTYRLDADGSIDLVGIIEGDFSDYSVDKTGSKCLICNTFCNNRVAYDNHLKTEHLEKIKCKVCDKQLFTLRSYLIHTGEHLGLRIFSCLICGKKVSRAGVLKDHMMRHNESYGCKCEICGRAFRSPYYLKRHIKKHDLENNKRFLCEFCDFKTHCKANLEYHIASHLNKKEYMCEYCGNRFNSLQRLDHHRLTHERPRFPCQFCKRKYRWLQKYHKHLKKDHSDKLTAENVIVEEVHSEDEKNVGNMYSNEVEPCSQNIATNEKICGKKSELLLGSVVDVSEHWFSEDAEPLND